MGRQVSKATNLCSGTSKVPSAQVLFHTKSDVQSALPEDDGCLSVLDKCLPAGLSPPAPSLLDPKYEVQEDKINGDERGRHK